MIVIRGTRAFRDRVPGTAAAEGEVSSGVLGCWYAGVLRWRRPAALFVNEATLLPLVLALAPAKTLLDRLPDALAEVLAAHRVPAALVEAERAAALEHRVAPTANRSVVGVMNEFASMAETYRLHGEVCDDLVGLAMRLSRVPLGPLHGRHVSADRELAALVATLTGTPAPTAAPASPARVAPSRPRAGGGSSLQAAPASTSSRSAGHRSDEDSGEVSAEVSGGPVEELAGAHVVTGLLRRAGRVLLVHRCPSRRWYPDAWDLPGGHVEAGETPRQALERELAEELGVRARVRGERFAHVQGATFRMDVWVIDDWAGEPTNLVPDEHDALAWLNDVEMGSLHLADPRLPQLVHAALQLPTP